MCTLSLTLLHTLSGKALAAATVNSTRTCSRWRRRQRAGGLSWPKAYEQPATVDG